MMSRTGGRGFLHPASQLHPARSGNAKGLPFLGKALFHRFSGSGAEALLHGCFAGTGMHPAVHTAENHRIHDPSVPDFHGLEAAFRHEPEGLPRHVHEFPEHICCLLSVDVFRRNGDAKKDVSVPTFFLGHAHRNIKDRSGYVSRTVWKLSGSPCATLFITVHFLPPLTENLQYQRVIKDQAVPGEEEAALTRISSLCLTITRFHGLFPDFLTS